MPAPRITPRAPEGEIPLLDWSWHKRRLGITLASACFYLAPLCLIFGLPPGALRMTAILLAIGFGLWQATPSRRWIDIVVLVLELWPNDDWRLSVWLIGFVVTLYADGVRMNRSEPPDGEWD
jgi:hypothetical protein